MEPRILRLNMAGQPIAWMPWQEAATLYARDQVGWTLGSVVKRVRGGVSRLSGRTSFLELPAIMACDGQRLAPMRHRPPLINRALFLRDNHQCLYCGKYFRSEELSRDHVVPSSRGGLNRWENVVAACKRCNHFKGSHLLNEIGLELLALPYCPNAAEYLALINSERILGDQAAYLKPQFRSYQLPERLRA